MRYIIGTTTVYAIAHKLTINIEHKLGAIAPRKQFAAESFIQRNCTVKKSDVKAVIEELVEVIQDKLQESYAVKINGLGIFRLTVSSAPADEIKDFTPTKNIKKVFCRFAPEHHRDTDGTVARSFCTGTRLREYGSRLTDNTETTEP